MKIANYKPTGRNNRSSMVLSAEGDEEVRKVTELFGDSRVSYEVTDRVICIRKDPSSPYRWGKYEERAKRKKLSIVHSKRSKKLDPFGATPVEAVNWGEDSLTVMLPEVLSAPVKRTKPKRSTRDPGITLRQAVEAVNFHKAKLGEDLCLSVDSRGHLKALIEY